MGRHCVVENGELNDILRDSDPVHRQQDDPSCVMSVHEATRHRWGLLLHVPPVPGKIFEWQPDIAPTANSQLRHRSLHSGSIDHVLSIKRTKRFPEEYVVYVQKHIDDIQKGVRHEHRQAVVLDADLYVANATLAYCIDLVIRRQNAGHGFEHVCDLLQEQHMVARDL